MRKCRNEKDKFSDLFDSIRDKRKTNWNRLRIEEEKKSKRLYDDVFTTRFDFDFCLSIVFDDFLSEWSTGSSIDAFDEHRIVDQLFDAR